MTPVINEIIEEVITSQDAPSIIDFEHFKLWIVWQRDAMRQDHELRYELSNFSLYSKNPEVYWPYIEGALGLNLR